MADKCVKLKRSAVRRVLKWPKFDVANKIQNDSEKCLENLSKSKMVTNMVTKNKMPRKSVKGQKLPTNCSNSSQISYTLFWLIVWLEDI